MSHHEYGELPRNLSRLLARAARDPEMRIALFEERSEVANRIGVPLDSEEKAILDQAAKEDLAFLIDREGARPSAHWSGIPEYFRLGSFILFLGMVALGIRYINPMNFTLASYSPSGKISQTRANMSDIKSALVMCKLHTTFYPGLIGTPSAISIQAANRDLLGVTEETNILTKKGKALYESICAKEPNLPASRTWDGPYSDQPPDELMVDGWGTKIRYEWDRGLFLHSAGPDRRFDPIAMVRLDTYLGDDLFYMVQSEKNILRGR